MDFLSIAFNYAISILFFLFMLGAVVKAWFILPRRINDLERRIKQLENKEMN